MAASQVIEAMDVDKDRHLTLSPRFPRLAPDQLSLDGVQEGFTGNIIVAIAFAAH